MAVRSQVPPAIECDLTLRPDADTVVMLSASWCQYCRAARRFLHREHIKYCEYDIETSTEGRRRYRAQTTHVIPILSLRDQVFIGFDESQITQALIGYGLRGRQ